MKNLKQIKYIYKYLDFNGLIKTIENMSIRCTQAKNLNDEYDCSPPFNFVTDIKEKSFIVNYRNNSYQGVIVSAFRKNYITSFTASGFDNMLMWSHYTGNYLGGVIEFKKDNFTTDLHKVKYVNEPILISSDLYYFLTMQDKKYNLSQLKKDMYKLLLTKYKIWKYEQELRICILNVPDPKYNIISDNNKQYIYYPFKNNDVVSVYIGHRMPGFSRLKLWNIMNKNQIKAKIYEVSFCESEYKLNFDNEIKLQYILGKILGEIYDYNQEEKDMLKKELMQIDYINEDDIIKKKVNIIQDTLNS